MTLREEHIKLCKVLMAKLEDKSFYVNVDYSEDMPSGFIRRIQDNVSSQISFSLYSGNSCKLIVTQEQRNDSLLSGRLAYRRVVTDAAGTQVMKYVLELSTDTMDEAVDWFQTYFCI